MAEKQYDIIVIGGGPGGYTCAVRAAKRGKHVLLVEKDSLGGTCLNRGCIPTKTLLHGAALYRTVCGAAKFGVTAENVRLDYAKLRARTDRVVAKFVGGVGALLRGAGVEVLRGTASLDGPGCVVVDGARFRAGAIVLATGRAAARPELPGAELSGVYAAEEILTRETLPGSLILAGGGIAAAEFAELFSSLGCRVRVLLAGRQLLPEFDADVSAELERALQKRGVKILKETELLQIEEGLHCTCRQGEETVSLETEAVLFPDARRAALQDLGLERTGVQTLRGMVPVDARMRTNVPGIYAVGDMTGGPCTAQAAAAQGKRVADEIAGFPASGVLTMPFCVYTSPEVVSVGMTAEQAARSGRNVRTGTFRAAANGRSASLGETAGFVRLLSDAETGELLGAQAVAERATELAGELTAAMCAEATVEELAQAVHPHPSICEMLQEAADDSFGLSCNQL